MVKASMKARINSKVPQILPSASDCLAIPSTTWPTAIHWPIPGLIKARPTVNPTSITDGTEKGVHDNLL